MQDLDRHVGDLHSLIADREIELIQELTSAVLLQSEMFIQAAELCAELDCLLCFAQTALLNGYVKPQMEADSTVIEIRDGRHPISELCVESFVSRRADECSNPSSLRLHLT